MYPNFFFFSHFARFLPKNRVFIIRFCCPYYWLTQKYSLIGLVYMGCTVKTKKIKGELYYVSENLGNSGTLNP